MSDLTATPAILNVEPAEAIEPAEAVEKVMIPVDKDGKRIVYKTIKAYPPSEGRPGTKGMPLHLQGEPQITILHREVPFVDKITGESRVGKRYIIFETEKLNGCAHYSQVAKVYDNQRHFYSYIQAHEPRRFYFDYDHKDTSGALDTMDKVEIVAGEHLPRVIGSICSAFKKVASIDLTAEDFYIFNSSRINKVSFHVETRNLFTKSRNDNFILATHAKTDPKPYNKNQLWRLPNSCKVGETNFKTLINGEALPKNRILPQQVDGCTEVLLLDEYKVNSKKYDTIELVDIPDEARDALLKLMPDCSLEGPMNDGFYQVKYNGCECSIHGRVHGSNNGYVFYKAGSWFFKCHSVRPAMKAVQLTKGKDGPVMLSLEPVEDVPAIVPTTVEDSPAIVPAIVPAKDKQGLAELEAMLSQTHGIGGTGDYQKLGRFPLEPYYLSDLIDECEGKHFDSMDEARSFILGKAVKCIAVILDMEKTAIIRVSEEEPLSVGKWATFCKTYTDYKISYIKQVKGGSVSVSSSIMSLLNVCPEISYTSVDNIPLHDHERFEDIPEYSKGKFNLFPGFKAKLLPKKDLKPELVQPILNHLKEVWADGSEQLFNYLVAWHADIIQNPRNKVGTSITLIGEQGAGKGITMKFEEKFVYGNRLSRTFNGLGQVTCKFNEHLMNMLMVNVDELSTVKGDFHSMFDEMKNLLTDDSINIEGKNKKTVYTRNSMRFRFASNNDHSLKVERGDRRYVAMRVSDKYSPSGDDSEKTSAGIAYFKNLADKINNQDVGNQWFSYLYYHKHDIDLKIIPKTSMRSELIEMNRPKHEVFFEEYVEELRGLVSDGQTSVKVHSATIYARYCDWIDEGKFGKPLNAIALGRELAKYFKQAPKQMRIDGISKVGLEIPI